MTSQFKKLTSLLLALVLTFTGLMGMSLTVQAEDPTPSGPNVDEHSELYAVKKLLYPAAPSPTENLTFTLVLTQVDPAQGEDNISSEPVGGLDTNKQKTLDVSIGFKAGDTSNSEKSANLLEDLTFPNVGYYKFELTEKIPDGATGDKNNIVKSTESHKITEIKYSLAKYIVVVEVRDDGNGNFVPYRIGVKLAQGQNGEAGDGKKLKPDPGDNLEDELAVRFENIYNMTLTENPGKDEPDPPTPPTEDTGKEVLKVSKKVTGAGGDKKAFFPFTLTLKNPENLIVDAASASYRAYIVQQTGTGYAVKTDKLDENGVTNADATSGVFDINVDEVFSFNLKHGESLNLLKAPVGLKWQAAETDTLRHKPTAELNIGAGTATAITDSENKTISSGEQVLKDNGTDTANNSFLVTNDRTDTEPPTGLFYDNMPFIVLMILAAIGIIFFTSKKTSHKREQA